jgi:hypothetical protein
MMCKDNAIASIGKTIKSHGERVADLKSMLGYWFQNLPLRGDKMEGKAQHDFLADIVLSEPEQLIAGLPELTHLLQVFGDIVGREKLCPMATRVKVKRFLEMLADKPIFKSNMAAVMAALTPEQAKRLEDLARQ